MFNKIPHFPSYSKWLKQKPSRDFFVSELILTWPFRIFPAIDSTKSKVSSIPKNIKDTLRKKQWSKWYLIQVHQWWSLPHWLTKNYVLGCSAPKAFSKKNWVKYDLFLQPIEVKRWALKLILTRWCHHDGLNVLYHGQFELPRSKIEKHLKWQGCCQPYPKPLF